MDRLARKQGTHKRNDNSRHVTFFFVFTHENQRSVVKYIYFFINSNSFIFG